MMNHLFLKKRFLKIGSLALRTLAFSINPALVMNIEADAPAHPLYCIIIRDVSCYCISYRAD